RRLPAKPRARLPPQRRDQPHPRHPPPRRRHCRFDLTLAARVFHLPQPMTTKTDLQGKTALVTGAPRGLGPAIARTLASRGANVAINYYGSADRAARLVDEISLIGGSAKAFRADVRDESAVRTMVAEIAQSLGEIDIAVCNATGPQPFLSLEDL